MFFRVQSKAFKKGDEIPQRFTGEGHDISPPIEWENLPKGTKELLLICEDSDAGKEAPAVHWLVYKIPPTLHFLPEGIPPKEEILFNSGPLQGKNSWGQLGYRGPCPPKGTGRHHYHFHLWALEDPIELKGGADKTEVMKAIEGHVKGDCEVVATYDWHENYHPEEKLF